MLAIISGPGPPTAPSVARRGSSSERFSEAKLFSVLPEVVEKKVKK